MCSAQYLFMIDIDHLFQIGDYVTSSAKKNRLENARVCFGKDLKPCSKQYKQLNSVDRTLDPCRFQICCRRCLHEWESVKM
jgi:hypothetical protein